MTRYLEDFTVGETFAGAPGKLDTEAIIRFAERYDPQVFHTDPEAAKSSAFGGLIASGHQTIGWCFGQIVRLGIFDGDAVICGADMTRVRWLLPVRPDMTLTPKAEVVELRPSKSKPDRGYLKIHFSVDGPDGTVASFYTTTVIRVRPGATAGDAGETGNA